MEKERMRDEEGKPILVPEKALSSPDQTIPFNSKSDDTNRIHGSNGLPSAAKNADTVNRDVVKAKSCKGCLYYSSRFKGDSRNPVCVGLNRSIPKVARYIFGQTEREATKEGRSLTDFRYACVGHSIYVDQKEDGLKGQETQTELPICSGFEVIGVLPVNVADSASAAMSHVHNQEGALETRSSNNRQPVIKKEKDGNAMPQRRPPKQANSTRDDFMSRFARNANLVANGVAKNMHRVGNQIKQSLDDVLYPYRRPPK